VTQVTEERVAQYTRAALNLLPQGAAWNRERASVMAQLFGAVAAEYAAIDTRVEDLIRELDPRSTLELLDAWERALGLPDECSGQLTTIAERRAAVLARLVPFGGQSPGYFISLADTLGYSVAIQQHVPFLAGMARAGDRLTNNQSTFLAGVGRAGDRISNLEEWLWTVDVIAPLQSVRSFRAGHAVAGERLAVWQNALLECTLSHVAPAHVLMRFLYVDTRQVERLSVGISAPPIVGIYLSPILPMTALLASTTILYTNAVATVGLDEYNLPAGIAGPMRLPSAFFTSEQLRGGGLMCWFISGAFANNTGAPITVLIKFFSSANAGTPFFTAAIEAIPFSTGGVGIGQFEFSARMHVRDSNLAQFGWDTIWNPVTAPAGTLAGGQDPSFRDGDVGKNWIAVGFNADREVWVTIEKAAADNSIVNTHVIQCVGLVIRDGTTQYP
jgi:uncharacterized protein YmfQ (DUF2313 family)